MGQNMPPDVKETLQQALNEVKGALDRLQQVIDELFPA